MSHGRPGHGSAAGGAVQPSEAGFGFLGGLYRQPAARQGPSSTTASALSIKTLVASWFPEDAPAGAGSWAQRVAGPSAGESCSQTSPVARVPCSLTSNLPPGMGVGGTDFLDARGHSLLGAREGPVAAVATAAISHQEPLVTSAGVSASTPGLLSMVSGAGSKDVHERVALIDAMLPSPFSAEGPDGPWAAGWSPRGRGEAGRLPGFLAGHGGSNAGLAGFTLQPAQLSASQW